MANCIDVKANNHIHVQPYAILFFEFAENTF